MSEPDEAEDLLFIIFVAELCSNSPTEIFSVYEMQLDSADSANSSVDNLFIIVSVVGVFPHIVLRYIKPIVMVAIGLMYYMK